MPILSLFLLFLVAATSAQETNSQRVRAQTFPLSIEVPADWQSFPPDSKVDPNEVLFFQTPDSAPFAANLVLSAHATGGTWEDLVKRQTYHLLVFEGAPLQSNEALRLHGLPGHKWVYKAPSPDGVEKLYYRLYLLLPPTAGSRRLLVLQGSAPAEQALEMLPFFNQAARSLQYGL